MQQKLVRKQSAFQTLDAKSKALALKKGIEPRGAYKRGVSQKTISLDSNQSASY